MTKAARERYYLASKIWRGGDMLGWTSLHWTPSKKDSAILDYFDRHGFIEKDQGLMRLTAKGRSALGLEPVEHS